MPCVRSSTAICAVMSHLVNHDAPQQPIHRVPLLWRVVHNHNPFRLVVCQRSEVGDAEMVFNTGCWRRMSS